MSSASTTPYENYYKIFYDYLVSSKICNKEVAESLVKKLQDEEVLLRLSDETLKNPNMVIKELSKYIPTAVDENSGLLPKPVNKSIFKNKWVTISIGSVAIVVISAAIWMFYVK